MFGGFEHSKETAAEGARGREEMRQEEKSWGEVTLQGWGKLPKHTRP